MPSDPFISQHLVATRGYQDLKTPVILTSGEIGIYYVNAEKMTEDGGEFNNYGNNANAMIAHACRVADANPSFGRVIDIMAAEIMKSFATRPSSFYPSLAISGGQRRDWLFSGPIARRLKAPHISCYKNGEVELFSEGILTPDPDLSEYHVAHVADLLTKASSCYDRRRTPPTGWIPMVTDKGGLVSDVFTSVDRMQGGRENLRHARVDVTSFVDIDEEFLQNHSKQPEVSVEYVKDPQAWSEGYIRMEGVGVFVPSFGPKAKDDRNVKFLAVYEKVLRETGRWGELSDMVKGEFGIDIDALPYREVKTGDE